MIGASVSTVIATVKATVVATRSVSTAVGTATMTVKAVDIILSDDVRIAYFRAFDGSMYATQAVGFLAATVHLDDGFGSFGCDDLQIDG